MLPAWEPGQVRPAQADPAVVPRRTVYSERGGRELYRAIRARGLAIEGFGGDRTVTIPATTQASDVDATDLIIVLCKSHSTRAAARSVRHLVDGGAVVVSFQNGLGNEQVIAEELGTDNVLGGVTTMAAVKLAPGRIRDFARAPSTIGEMAGGCE